MVFITFVKKDLHYDYCKLNTAQWEKTDALCTGEKTCKIRLVLGKKQHFIVPQARQGLMRRLLRRSAAKGRRELQRLSDKHVSSYQKIVSKRQSREKTRKEAILLFGSFAESL